MKKLVLCIAIIVPLFPLQKVKALDTDATITAIFGSGNPDTGWVSDTQNGITLALRGKNRLTGETPHSGTEYTFPIGVQPSTTRALWNWEFSIDSGNAFLDEYDYYVGIDMDESQETSLSIVDALTFWSDNSYGTSATLNGAGVEGPASLLAGGNTICQQSQNITFYGQSPLADATYTYVLYAVAKGAGPDGLQLSSVSITVKVGNGGAAFLDDDGDGVPNRLDSCPGTPPDTIVTADGCSIQELTDNCATSAQNHGDYVSCIAQTMKVLFDQGLITREQRSEYISAAAKSGIGK